MTLSPEDIQNKEFNVCFRGFDADEVDNFLEDVAEQYLLLQVEKKKYKERTAKLKEEMVQLKEEQKSFQKAFIAAQKIAEEMQEKGRRESEEMLEEAREEIDRMRAQAEEERKNLEDEVESLRQVKTEIIAELRQYLQANIDRLDNDDPLDKPTLSFTDEAEEEVVVENDNKEISSEPEADDDIADTDENVDDDELDDLYQKIDLPDIDDSLAGDNQEQEPEEKEKDMHSNLFESISARLEEDKEEESPTIPDLDGDMLFRLEDPLEDMNEPAVVLDDEEKKS
jgi:cell division initiation protein